VGTLAVALGFAKHPIFYNEDLDQSLAMTCGRPGVCQLSTRWARAIMKKLELEQLRRHEQD